MRKGGNRLRESERNEYNNYALLEGERESEREIERERERER